MNIHEFWAVVERIHAAAPQNMAEKCRLLTAELRQLPCDEIVAFGRQFRGFFYQAYSWELWAAAYIINKGCSDDGFMDFRSTIISLGRGAYQASMRDADSLVEFNIAPAWACFEGYQYVARTVFQEKCRSADLYETLQGSEPHPARPSGRDWQVWDLQKRFPRLALKYGWQESDWSSEKKRHEKIMADEEKGRQIAQLLLNAHIIPSCGMIPPPRIALEVIRSQQSPSPSARVTAWEPLEIDEGHYWIAVRHLNRLSPSDIANRPDLAGIKIAVDVQAGPATTYADWVASLNARSLAWP